MAKDSGMNVSGVGVNRQATSQAGHPAPGTLVGGGAAQNSGPYSVSPAPRDGVAGSRERLDRPAASHYIPRLDCMPWPFGEFYLMTRREGRNGHAHRLVVTPQASAAAGDRPPTDPAAAEPHP